MTTNSATLNWDSVVGATQYKIYLSVDGGSTHDGSPVTVSGTTHTYSGSLPNDQDYWVKVVAYNGATPMSEESDWTHFKTL